MAFQKITDYESNIKDLPDRPSSAGITTDELKRFFDGRTDKEVKQLFNKLIDELMSEQGAGQIGVPKISNDDDSEGNIEAKLIFVKKHTDELVQRAILTLKDDIISAKNAAEFASQQASAAQKFAEDAQHNAEEAANTAAEKAAEQAAEEAVLNVRDLLEEHVSDSETARNEAQTAQTAAENAKSEAEKIFNDVSSLKSLTEDAKVKAELAQKFAEAARDSAITAQGKAETAYNNAVTAQGKAETAQAKAETAATRAETAKTSAETAKDEAEKAANEAKNLAENAAQDATDGVEKLLAQHVQNSTDAKNAAESFAQDAAASAKAANEYAQTVNPDEIRNMIEMRGDNLEFDESEGLLYLTAGGTRISDGIKVITTGGGGGGGESNNAVLSLKNTTGFLYKTISHGSDLYLTGEWSSLEDEMSTGPGVMKITVGGIAKQTSQIEQGAFSFNVGQMLSAGTNSVRLTVTDTYGNSRSISFNITSVALQLTSSFDDSVAYEGDFTLPYIPTAAVNKTMHFIVDGKEIGTEEVLASGREQSYTIPAQTHGMHTIEAYYDAVIDGETVESDKLYYNVACKVAGDNTPIIVMDIRQQAAEQFDTVVVPWWVYDPASLTANVTLTSAAGSQNLTVDRTEQSWSYRPEYVGEDILTISCVGSGLNAEGVNPLAVVQKV
ncbi:MAG: hypothetical protein IJO47_05615, partial [Clostridia bacterium]|nr:hypothetical protein [Clostridia bacterium]